MNDDENDENRRPQPPFIQLDFKTAGGRNITVKEETIEIAKTRVTTIETPPENDQHDPTKTTSAFTKHDLNSTRGLISNPSGANMMFSDFQTGSGKRLSVSKEKLTILAEKFAEPQPTASTTTITTTAPPAEIFSGFQTATGRKLTVSKESLEAEAQKLAKLGESIAIELAPPPPVVKQPVEVRKPQVGGAVGSLRDAKPFKKPQFVMKKTVEKSESTTSVLDQTTLVPLNDLFDDMPVQKPPPLPSPASFPPMLKPIPKREQSGSSESSSSSSSSSALKSPIKFSNFHFFSSASFMPEKVAYLKIASVQIVESVGGECVMVRPQTEIVSQDVRYFKYFY